MRTPLLFAGILLTSSACRDKECTPEDFDGQPFLSEEGSPGVVSGTATWSDSIDDGELIDFRLEWADGSGFVGAVSNGGLFDMTKTCGGSIDFRIENIPTDEWIVFVGIQDGDSGGDTGDIAYVAEGRSEAITVDGTVSGLKIALE